MTSPPCFVCGGPWHPATGFLMGPSDALYCGPCHRAFIDWLKRRVNSMRGTKNRPDFNLAAATSIRVM
ncbi:MAG: hypothetical protein Q8S13_12685 [Dehalococcoidia bacterium]|nr:hypothetical protein [Dehalococcoidia bacterium]